MFHIDADNKLAYLNSLNVKVFPSGRRKSELVNENDLKERYHIPIDPEARLNTEANHRKHSGLNGYKQSYILGWTSEYVSLVLAGYLFNIKLSDGYTSIQRIGEYLATNLEDTAGNAANKIYANILTADMAFFSSVDGSTNNEATKVGTEILRDQSFSAQPKTCLDLLKLKPNSTNEYEPQNKAASYYFSGLSFSAEPLKQIKENGGQAIPANMHPFSLQILTKGEDSWHICESSRLPEIDHGDTKDSVKIPGDLTVEGNLTVNKNINVENGTLTAKEVIIGDMKAITLEVVQTTKADTNVATDKDKWQLRFHNAKVTQLE